MGKRRDARERALQILFELEFNEAGPEAVLARAGEDSVRNAETAAYSAWLVKGVAARRDELDGRIQGAADNWRVARMGLIDRNILRIAVFEMFEDPNLVPAIVINEAVEIARRFSGEESAVFVNGVLDAVRRARSGGETRTVSETTPGGNPPPVTRDESPPSPAAPKTRRKSIAKKDSHDRTQKRPPLAGARRASVRSPLVRRRSPKK
jgi:N utilization substance protein B